MASPLLSFQSREGLTMKALAISTLTLVLALGIVAGAVAQTATPPPGGTITQPGASTPPANAPSARTPQSPSAPQAVPGTSSSDSSKDVNVNTRTERRDAVDASPRTSADSRRVFGLNPTAAALIAAALLVVVILAIVSMSRGASRSDTRIDVDRRL